ncbi:MAG: SDR family oxidoreductase [Crocinitomicaceae bacterium]|jgi:NAD(P)-dependent dehydrogenase (short-subunit alcohol dehydrogenase family)
MRNYLIIGGSSGIGASIVAKLSESSDDKVLATYFSNAAQNSDNVQFFHYNAMIDNLADYDIPDEIHGFVYCPGAIMLKPFKRLTEQGVIDDFKLQVIGAMNTIQAILPNLTAAKNASVVLFSTVAVQQGFNFHSQVAMSKGAIEGLTKSLAAEFAPAIRVNCIAPSLTDTPLAEQLLSSEEKRKANADRHPMKQIGTADDSAELAVFLLSEKSKWMTGQIIHIDGGMSSIKM